MKTEEHKKVMELIVEFDKNPKAFENSPAKELIMERKNINEKEKNLAKEIIDFQNDIEAKMINYSTRMMKLKGTSEYIGEKILEVI